MNEKKIEKKKNKLIDQTILATIPDAWKKKATSH